MNDPQCRKSTTVRFFKIRFHDVFDVARRDGMQIEHIADGYFDRVIFMVQAQPPENTKARPG
jgi:hypothetical protein